MDIPSSKQIRAYVSAKGLTALMNNTKWRRLFEALNAHQRMFMYRRQDLDGSTFPEDGLSFTPEIEQYWGAFNRIETFDILAYKEIRLGVLLEPKIEDFSNELIELAKSVGARFTLIDRGIRVWGYVRPGDQPDLI